MAGSQGSVLAIAVSNAGGLGSQPCAMLAPDGIRRELQAIAASTSKPVNVNFFVHKPPARDSAREASWRQVLAPYFAEYGIQPAAIADGPARIPFDDAAADVLEEFRPPVVSFHFGLPSAELMRRVKSWGSKILSSATTVDEARYLEAHGVDAVIAQGYEAGGHRGMFLSDELEYPGRYIPTGSTGRASGDHPGDRGRRDCGCAGGRGGHRAGRGRRPGWDGLFVLSGSDDESSASRGPQERRRA